MRKILLKPNYGFHDYILIVLFILILIYVGFYFYVFGFLNIIRIDKTSGAFGDTIGGLASPVINLIASILIYLSFREQKNANDLQNKKHEQEQLLSNKLYNAQILSNEFMYLTDEYNRFNYKQLKNDERKRGLNAVNKFVFHLEKGEVKTAKSLFLKHYNFFLISFYNMVYLTLNRDLEPEDKELLLRKMFLFMKIKMVSYNTRISSCMPKTLNEFETDLDRSMLMIKTIYNQTEKYLLKQK